MRAQSQIWKGIAMPRPAIRLRCSGGILRVSSFMPFMVKDKISSNFGKRWVDWRLSISSPRKLVRTSSALRRPILRPKKNAPSGHRRIGTEGCPTLPRTGSPLTSRPSASSSRMITDTVCADNPVARAISALASAVWRRTSVRTSRSLRARIPLWLVPRADEIRTPSARSSFSELWDGVTAYLERLHSGRDIGQAARRCQ